MTLRHAWLAAFAAVLLLAQALHAQPITITPVPVRAFGYSIGDRVERRVDLWLAPPWSLTQGGLPTPGRQSPWFDLVEITSTSEAAKNGTHVELRFVYQLLNSPVQPTALLLPRVRLKFEGGPQPVERDVPPVDLFASPLLPPAAAGSTLDAMRADRKPELIPVEHFRQRLTVYGLVAAAILAWMLVVQQLASRRRAGPFVRACRELRNLARASSDVARAETAMRVVHRALDETAGHTVFVDNVDTLFESAHRAPLRARTLAFLDRSRQRFFAGAGEAVPLQELRDFAHAWRTLEGRR
jgi:mxaA protein